MASTLPQVGHEHHERLLVHVNEMPALADALLTGAPDEVHASLAALNAFFAGTLVPHMDTAEHALYGELERMYQNRHSMAPMRREHEEIRRLVAELAKLVGQVEAGHTSQGRTLAIRRVMFTLYALLKVHLAEEEAYLRVVEHEVTADMAEILKAALEHPVLREA